MTIFNFRKPLTSTPPLKPIGLPNIKLNNITWPMFELANKTKLSSYVMSLHPVDFGKTLLDPFKANCNHFWKDYFL